MGIGGKHPTVYRTGRVGNGNVAKQINIFKINSMGFEQLCIKNQVISMLNFDIWKVNR